MTIEIGRATTDDASGIATVHVSGLQEAYRDVIPPELLDPSKVEGRARHWERWIQRTRATTSVARRFGDVVGFAAIHPAPTSLGNEGTKEVAAIFVDPEHWGSGVGTELLDHALAGSLANGAGPAVAWVLESNDRAMRFYEARGFSPDNGCRVNRGVPKRRGPGAAVSVVSRLSLSPHRSRASPLAGLDYDRSNLEVFAGGFAAIGRRGAVRTVLRRE